MTTLVLVSVDLARTGLLILASKVVAVRQSLLPLESLSSLSSLSLGHQPAQGVLRTQYRRCRRGLKTS